MQITHDIPDKDLKSSSPQILIILKITLQFDTVFPHSPSLFPNLMVANIFLTWLLVTFLKKMRLILENKNMFFFFKMKIA